MEQPGTGWAPNTELCSRWGNYSGPVQTRALAIATKVIWAATGRRYGLESVTVRPSRPVQSPLYRTYPVGFAGYGFWTLYGINGGDAFQIVDTCGCGASSVTGISSCSCGAMDIAIPDNVSAITSVTVDGVLVPSGSYVLAGGYLTRIDGSAWPYVQNFAIPAGQPGTWSITYQQGSAVPDDIQDAAGLYACQIGAGLSGGTCALPNRVQSITRQGLQIDLIDPGKYLEENRTGYDLVDQILAADNPYGLRQRTRFLSPDMPKFRR